MSRCFPFPPPGYEKKTRPDDADLLKKEKHREKKHKKEKKDKEKREGKEKKEKDRSDGKHREKKDRKEKHKDKKDKEKDRAKEKSSTSEEKRVADQSEGYSGEKVHPKEERPQGKDQGSSSDEKKAALHFRKHNGEKPIRNNVLAVESEDSKFVQELGRRIRDEEKGTGSLLVERFTGTDWKKDEGMDRFSVRNTGTLAEGKEKNKDKRVDNKKMDGQGIRDEARSSGNAMSQHLSGIAQNKVERMPRPLEKIEGTTEGKEKCKEREDDKRGDKCVDKGREKKSHGKDKDREKDKKKEEKTKEKREHKRTEQDRFKGINNNDLIGAIDNKTPHKDCDKHAAAEGNLKKRKGLETNGFLHDNELRPNKIRRPTSHLLTDNGRKLEPCQAPSLFTSDRQGPANNFKVDNKEHKANGLIDTQRLSVSTTKPLHAVMCTDQIAEASSKPPHHDLKYLSQVLVVPKMEEWSDFDDQEWLFSSKDPLLKKPEVGSYRINEEPQVWSEALQMESADVCALPYVIPY